MNVCTNPSGRSENIYRLVRCRKSQITKSVGLIHWGPWTTVQKFTVHLWFSLYYKTLPKKSHDISHDSFLFSGTEIGTLCFTNHIKVYMTVSEYHMLHLRSTKTDKQKNLYSTTFLSTFPPSPGIILLSLKTCF